GFEFSAYQWVILTLGTIVSFITALVVVKFFMDYLKKFSLRPFAVYRILLGIAVLIFCL
ncbi:MAG: undecaprenyl-diphosphatase, partial [Spirochaetia bacterium]|nr:undecaprenyl-diphosphatase [Spirochaetia bacterium]